MTEKDYRKDFMGAKKNFLKKKGYYDLKNPKKSPFHYLESLTLDDVIFDVNSAKIHKVYYDYNVSSSYNVSSTPTTTYYDNGNSTTTTKSSSGSMDNFYSNTPWVYQREIFGKSYDIPDEIKGIFNLSKTYKFHNNPYDFIYDDARAKLAKSYNETKPIVCVGQSDIRVNIKSHNKHDSGEIFRELAWTGIYLKNSDGSRGDLIGYGYHKEGKTLFRFYGRESSGTAFAVVGVIAAIVVGAIILFSIL